MDSSLYHRMPLGFGPFPGPRQAIGTCRPHLGWDEVKTQTASIVFKTSRSHLSAFLPHDCFSIDSALPDDQAYASFSFTKLENLPWLAGGGYNYFGLYIHDVVCRGKEDTRRGKYLSVLFEDRADPIISGREELGYSKLFANLTSSFDNFKFKLDVSWEGAVFGELSLADFQEIKPVPQGSEAKEPDGLLHFKYIPKTGSLSQFDVQYPTFTPPPAPSVSTIKVQLEAEKPTFKFKDLGFNKLPTLHHVAARLAEFDAPGVEVIRGEIILAEGASDLSNILAIDI